jgi:release factor glutamine methyltransferase
MRNSKAVLSEIISSIQLNESMEEKEAVAMILIGHFFDLSRSAILTGAPVDYSQDQERQMRSAISRISSGEPVQYVIGTAHFLGNDFLVTPEVLIPRPETEELVAEIVRYIRTVPISHCRLTDLGTGSGCIPISVALQCPGEYFSTDVSAEALSVARKNSARLKADVTFLQHDILQAELPIIDLDVLVSNPPYIAQSEIGEMKDNVVMHEPHLALFVNDDDPLIFYNRISRQGRQKLKRGGLIIFEINERFGGSVASVLKNDGYNNVTIVRDLSGKERIVKAIQP